MSLTVERIIKKPPQLRNVPLTIERIKENPGRLQIAPITEENLELCFQIVNQNASYFPLIPVKFRNENLCRLAVRLDPQNHSFVPKTIRELIQLEDSAIRILQNMKYRV